MPDFVKIKQVVSPAETGVSQNKWATVNCQLVILHSSLHIFYTFNLS